MASKKAMTVEMPNGVTYIVAAEHIAHDRATYYAGKGESYTETFKETMADDGELEDWAANNMNWSDVREHAQIYTKASKPVDYEDGWCNGDKSVIPSPKSLNLSTPGVKA